MMNKLTKILPVLAIVAGIGGAFGFSADDEPCEKPNHIGYEYTGAGEPTEAPDVQANLRELGEFGDKFECDSSPSTCHWVYLEEAAEGQRWIPCEGELVE